MDPRVALRLPEDDKEEKRMPEDDAFLSVIAGLIFLSVIAGLIFLSVIAGLGPAIQRYKDIRHLLTICTQKASRSNKGSRRSRSYGQAGNSLSLPGLFFFLSLPALARQSNYDP
jgi:hypothetical protein